MDIFMPNFREEFPNYPADQMPQLPEGWTDHSWGNDACPSFVFEAKQIALFVDYPDPKDREFDDLKRFHLFYIAEDGTWMTDSPFALYDGDSLEDALWAAAAYEPSSQIKAQMIADKKVTP
jgi:hypothetical protein